MNFKNMNSIKSLVISLGFLFSILWADNALAGSDIKLYAMDCGTIDVADMQSLSAKGEYNGQKVQLVNPCFLIRHKDGDLLWDTGHIDNMADSTVGVVNGVWHSKLKTKLIDQLSQLSISPTDIEYLSLSHLHPDHAGNANKFIDSTFIVNELEREYMFSEQIKPIFGQYYLALEKAKTIVFKTEYDVFGDATVVIKSMPGHTPGSSVLLVRLGKAGNILLSGDLYIHGKGRELKTMLMYNTDLQSTIDSRSKFEALAKQENARVIIQHEKQDFVLLPKFPKFLD
jgi:glyoxylase-like metal-dependent hydrolase (beta-lactamase superfamily II)